MLVYRQMYDTLNSSSLTLSVSTCDISFDLFKIWYAPSGYGLNVDEEELGLVPGQSVLALQQ